VSEADTVLLYHGPQSRSSGTLTLLEELGAPYELHVLNLKAGEQRQAAYLAVNPMGKVPAIRHHGALVTEQVAIALYLADQFPQAGLAPAIGDKLRGPYLRWMAYYAGCFEPAIIDRALKRDPAPAMMSSYGDFDTMLATLDAQLAGGPWLLGERFTAADVLWGTATNWVLQFGLMPPTPAISAYAARATARPAYQRARETDAALAARQEAEAAN
jgi:glutathione S-transferase